jgi:hypothetical protein
MTRVRVAQEAEVAARLRAQRLSCISEREAADTAVDAWKARFVGEQQAAIWREDEIARATDKFQHSLPHARRACSALQAQHSRIPAGHATVKQHETQQTAVLEQLRQAVDAHRDGWTNATGRAQQLQCENELAVKNSKEAIASALAGQNAQVASWCASVYASKKRLRPK